MAKKDLTKPLKKLTEQARTLQREADEQNEKVRGILTQVVRNYGIQFGKHIVAAGDGQPSEANSTPLQDRITINDQEVEILVHVTEEEQKLVEDTLIPAITAEFPKIAKHSGNPIARLRPIGLTFNLGEGDYEPQLQTMLITSAKHAIQTLIQSTADQIALPKAKVEFLRTIVNNAQYQLSQAKEMQEAPETTVRFTTDRVVMPSPPSTPPSPSR